MKIGIDIGSTTIKAAILEEDGRLIHSEYRRHYSLVRQCTQELLTGIGRRFPQAKTACVAVTGSAGMGLAEAAGLPFVQEVHATRICADQLMPDTDVIIELGGEDAKILFQKGIPDARMNGSCAGGTGAFIDQMATLLGVTPEQLNELAGQHTKIYTIASRCGVFAKSDIQPLLNQGAQESDIAASILSAVVNQTIAGLAQGRPIEGQVLYLGGPLTFLSELRASFDRTLGLQGICPEHSLYYAALGAALCAVEPLQLPELEHRLLHLEGADSFHFMPPLFESQAQYDEFTARHAAERVATGDLDAATEGVCLGIDAGSTTIKMALIGPQGELLHSSYQKNSGNPVPLVKAYLQRLYAEHPNLRIARSAVTGYGEDLIRRAFCLDEGLVETVAHFMAAREIQPEVDFILDIGGQDIKCMKIHNGVIDNIYLNEACSSGCGSFLQTFANALDYEIEDFSKLGLFADRPVDLGSRCTVFMNSSVKQAQKDGASIENISAGLSISVIKNALYKVIRPGSMEELGRHVVVQGGTFYNDAVLRAFEQELGFPATRPDIAGLMGAYGAALYARERHREQPDLPSTTMGAEGLAAFTHRVSTTTCGGCQNNCALTVNVFDGGRSQISGNRCERPVTRQQPDESLNHYEIRRQLLLQYLIAPKGRERIGIPLGLNMVELLPFWSAFFDRLGYDILLSPHSDHALYLYGQDTIPSDTVCYPAKLMHGHIQKLIDDGVSTIFYPCMSYTPDEGRGDNFFNCPVVAYYPEVVKNNMPDIRKVNFIGGYVGLHRRKELPAKLQQLLSEALPNLRRGEVKQAVDAGFAALERYLAQVRESGLQIVQQARAQGKPIVVLAGRPYHIDSEINHGIDKLILSLGAAVVGEYAICDLPHDKPQLAVLNQWTFHGRLYDAAQVVAASDDMQFVQLVSFGCGCDAITTDECRRLLEHAGKIYTQIKIDEIDNLGAARIRLRSLFAATDLMKVRGDV